MIGPLLLTIGCAPGPIGAEAGSTITINETFEDGIYMEAEYAVPGDGIGLLLLQEAVVVDPEGLAANGIQVEVISGFSGAYVVAEGAVKLITDYEANCDLSEEDCAAWFDVQNEQYVEFSGEYETVGDFRPGYMSGVTNARGVMPFYVFIDSQPLDADFEPLPISVYASIGVATASLSYEFI